MWGCLSSQGGTWSLGVTAASPWAAALAQHEAEELRHRSRQRARGRISLVVPRFPPPAGVGSRPSGHVTRSSSYLALACVPVVCLVIKTLIWPSQRKSNFFSLRTGAFGTEARVRRTSSSRLLAYPSRGVCSQAVRGSHRSCCLVMDVSADRGGGAPGVLSLLCVAAGGPPRRLSPASRWRPSERVCPAAPRCARAHSFALRGSRAAGSALSPVVQMRTLRLGKVLPRGRSWGLDPGPDRGAVALTPWDARVVSPRRRTSRCALLSRRPSWSSSTPACGTSLPWGRTTRRRWQVRLAVLAAGTEGVGGGPCWGVSRSPALAVRVRLPQPEARVAGRVPSPGPGWGCAAQPWWSLP